MTNKDAVVKYKREEAKRKRLAAEAAAAEKERIRLEEIDIQKQIEAGIFTGAKGGKISKNGITRMRKGGKPAVKPKKPTHRNMLEGSRPMRPLEDIFYNDFDKKSKTSAPKSKRNGGKIAKMAHGGGIELRGKTRGRIT